MVKVNYPRGRSRRHQILQSHPILICCTLVVILMIINQLFPSQMMEEEKEVLTNLYRDEKKVMTHLIYGKEGEAGVKSGSDSVKGDDITDDGMDTNMNNEEEKEFPGWKPVHIFYGDQKHLAYLGRESQVGQDKLVMGLLKNQPDGFFIDLAANDATNLSNTYQLEKQLKWNGICIEPNPIYWTSLSHRKCHIAAAVVGKNRMEEIQFRMYPDLKKRAPSGGIEGYIDPKIPRSKEKSVDLYTVPFLEILEKFDAPNVIEYLSLDVEGSEFFVMEAFPFDRYKFKVLTIERPRQELVDLLIRHDYIYLAANTIDGEETSWVHKSMKEEINTKAIEDVGWITGDTKWMITKNGKSHVQQGKKKKGGK